MTALGFTLFGTEIGTCAIAWGEHGIVGSQLPERDTTATRARITNRFPAAGEVEPPREVRTVTIRLVELLAGANHDLADAVLDMSDVPDFHRRVYELTRTIRPGETLTYGDIAHKIGSPGSAQAVGQAMGLNPFAPIVPCHRVRAADGGVGGFSASGGITTKRRMLAIESVHTPGALPFFT